MTDNSATMITRTLSIAVVVASALFSSLYLFVVLSRISYPFELEWLEGLSLQHVKRVLGDGDLYVKPTIDFVPNLYPPLHAYLGAIVCSICGADFASLRGLSFVSSLGLLVLIFLFVARETSTRASYRNVPAMVAVGLFIATYDRVGGWLDIARVDSLFLLFVMLGFYVLRFSESKGGFVAAGVLFVLAGFVKQSGFVMAIPLIGAMVWAYRRRGFYFGGAVGVIAAILTIILAGLYDGSWFYYYVIEMPLRHPKVKVPSRELFWGDFIAPLPIATFLACVALLPKDPGAPKHRQVMLGAFLLSGIGVSWMVRSRVGTFLNDIIPAYLAVSILAGVGLERVLRRARESKEWSFVPPFALALVLIQFWMLRYDAVAHIPTLEDRQAGDRVVAQLRAIPGDIFIPHHGYLAEMAGKRSFAHTLAIDNLRVEDPGPAREFLERQIVSGLEQRRFAAVVVESDGWSIKTIEQYYQPGRALHLTSGVFFPREGGHLRPEFIFFPK